MTRPRVCFVSADPITPDRFQRGQLSWLRERGFDVVVVASPGPDLERVRRREGVRAIPVAIPRAISPAADALALLRLVDVFRRSKPEIVVAGTPKGGLLGTLAARGAGVPVVVYHLRGLRLETASGGLRAILRLTDRMSASAADRIQCNGASLRDRFVALGLGPAEKCFIPGSGSSNGVDAARFARDPAFAAEERERLGIPAEAPVVGFVGRLTADKGISELIDSFEALSTEGVHLVLVGDFDATDPVPGGVRERITRNPRIHLTGMLADPARMYGLFDVLAFPSHREGFPNAPLEAASAGVPTVGARATGTVDAVVDGVTGTLVPPGDPVALAAAIDRYLLDPALRSAHGDAARKRVEAEFRPEVVWRAIAQELTRLLADRGLSLPEPGGPSAMLPVFGPRRIKRALDVAVASAGLVAAAPAMAAVAGVIRLQMGSPVVFHQERAGEGGRAFQIYKFRTMKDATGPDGAPLPDAERLTRLGRLIRKTSLDELPQLWNVLRGDMSLVGPRPLYVRYIQRYSPEQARRHEVPPGITGWTAVNGRNALDWAEKLRLDVWYVDHWSLWLDVKILARTVLRVLAPTDTSNPGHATMPEFQGEGA
jgi:lipopolysaccharide/colanic/teichoic acid biosynthesis glycosyltransferase/glycosyltransferase involved in cell wall biosynthesis